MKTYCFIRRLSSAVRTGPSHVLPKSASAAQTLPSCLNQSIGIDMTSQLGEVRFGSADTSKLP
ncbi:MAG: hypothetical protein K9J46_23305, partial [Saprospiraceae bacterium]|nr:hypothetical protein [Saprospiraceae bacterium]